MNWTFYFVASTYCTSVSAPLLFILWVCSCSHSTISWSHHRFQRIARACPCNVVLDNTLSRVKPRVSSMLLITHEVDHRADSNKVRNRRNPKEKQNKKITRVTRTTSSNRIPQNSMLCAYMVVVGPKPPLPPPPHPPRPPSLQTLTPVPRPT